MLQAGEHRNFTLHPLGWQMLPPCTLRLGASRGAAWAGFAGRAALLGPPGQGVCRQGSGSRQGSAVSFRSSICLDEIQPSGSVLPHGGCAAEGGCWLCWQVTGNIPVEAIHQESPPVQGLDVAPCSPSPLRHF